MSNDNGPGRHEGKIVRRQLLKNGAITGGVLWSVPGVARAGDSSPIERILTSETVRSIEKAVPRLQIRSENARITAKAKDGNGRSVRVPGKPGTVHATELPNGTVFAVFRFPNDAPRRKLNVGGDVPEGAKAMLVGSPNGAYLMRSASPQERSRILQEVGLSDRENVRITTTSRSNSFEVARMDAADERVELATVRPLDGSVTESASDSDAFEIVSESVVTAGFDPADAVTMQSCDCGELAASVWLCFSTLNACSTAVGCSPFGGPPAVLACAVATGCIFGIISEMLESTGPGCVSLTQDLWNLCATECVY